ncbi:hypothetical protein F5Y10DRAFT_248033 [Nemania abortiva]|nr:hypothetical protein F5Y10DRAFT_248033 [Nemania abortiva]
MSSSTTIKNSFSKLLSFIPGFRRSPDNMASDYTVENIITHPYENDQHLHACLVSMGFIGKNIVIKANAKKGFTALLPYSLKDDQKKTISDYFTKMKREERKKAAQENDD